MFIVDFYYYEGDYRQRHLKESSAGRESSGLYMASRLEFAMRGKGLQSKRGGPREGKERGNQEKKTKLRDYSKILGL